MNGILWLLIKALVQGHDEDRLRSEMIQMVTSLWLSVPFTPENLSPELQQLVSTPEKLSIFGAGEYLDVMRSVAIASDIGLNNEILLFELTLARLGHAGCILRIGKRMMVELQSK